MNNQAVKLSDEVLDGATSFISAAFIRAAQAAQPWLAWPIVSTILKFFVNKWMGKLDTQIKNVFAHVIIDYQTGQEADAANKARDVLRAAQASGDVHAEQAASDAFDNAFGNLIHTHSG